MQRKKLKAFPALLRTFLSAAHGFRELVLKPGVIKIQGIETFDCSRAAGSRPGAFWKSHFSM